VICFVATIALPRRAVPSSPTLARAAAVLIALWVLAWASVVGGELPVFWVFGLAFGVILQRSRLCFASGFRDLFLLRDGGNLRAILSGLAVATLGFALIQVHAVPTPAPDTLPQQAHLFPLSAQILVGGFVFGVGMVLAGGCVSGTLYRVGEGYVGSIVALAGILAGLVVSTLHWNWWWQTFTANAPTIWLPGYLGYGGAVALTLAVLGLAYLATIWWELRAGPRPSFGAKRPAEAPAMSLGDWLDQRYRALFGRGWPILNGAIALAVLNVFVYLYDHPLGVTGELSNWGNRAVGLVGVHVPAMIGASGLAGCLLVMDPNAAWMNTGTMLDGGLVLGALIAALFAGEFKLRFPRQPVRYAQSLGGGVLMGYGAGIAAGCTIGAFFSALPSLGLNGWAFGLALLAGSWAGVQVIKRL
jgi:uncharacterized membrane protein YedE/YeeE